MAVTGEEFLLGYIPDRIQDRSTPVDREYDPAIPSPTWRQLMNSLDDEDIKPGMRIFIVFIGKDIYSSSASSSGIGGISGLVTYSDIINVVRGVEEKTREKGRQYTVQGLGSRTARQTRDSKLTGNYAAELLGQPQLLSGHITGIVWSRA